jgi:AcrR family transcriptional regulator
MGQRSADSHQELKRLPPGRHGLARSEVARSQRSRILASVEKTAALGGYQAMTIEDIVVGAGVSRRTFYDHFQTKEEAFLAAFDGAFKRLLALVETASEGGKDFADQCCRGLEAVTEFASSEPAAATLCFVEAMAAGQLGVERRNSALQMFARMIERAARQTLPSGASPSPLAPTAIAGGINEVVYSRLIRGEAQELRELVPDLLYATVLPYIGHDAAIAARDSCHQLAVAAG